MSKPKLLIVGDLDVPAEELSRRLGDQFEVVIESAGEPQPTPVDSADPANETERATKPPETDYPPGAHPAELLLNAIGEGICLVEAGGKEVWANDWFKALSPAIHERVRACYSEAASALARPDGLLKGAGGATCKFELSDPKAQVAYEVSIVPAGGCACGAHRGDGEPRLAVVVRDVSSARRLELRMAAIDRAGSELVELEAETIRESNSVERLKALETRIARIAHDLLHFDHFLIRLIDKETGRLEPIISVGLPSEAVDLELFVDPEGNGISGAVAATGQSVICDDVDSDHPTGLHIRRFT